LKGGTEENPLFFWAPFLIICDQKHGEYYNYYFISLAAKKKENLLIAVVGKTIAKM
jgi:hypothetical protein